MAKRKMTLRNEELPTAGTMILAAFDRDQADFISNSPDYGNVFKTDVTAQLAAVTELVNPKVLLGELKVITQRIYTNQQLLQQPLDELAGYIKRAAKNLSVAPADFGLSAARRFNNNGNIEGLSTALKDLLKVVELNMDALTARGYTAQKHATLKQMQADFIGDNVAQKLKQQQRADKVAANIEVLDAFWGKLVEICDTGKILYKKKAPHKLPDYTMDAIKKSLRNEGKKGKGDVGDKPAA